MPFGSARTSTAGGPDSRDLWPNVAELSPVSPRSPAPQGARGAAHNAETACSAAHPGLCSELMGHQRGSLNGVGPSHYRPNALSLGLHISALDSSPGSPAAAPAYAGSIIAAEALHAPGVAHSDPDGPKSETLGGHMLGGHIWLALHSRLASSLLRREASSRRALDSHHERQLLEVAAAGHHKTSGRQLLHGGCNSAGSSIRTRSTRASIDLGALAEDTLPQHLLPRPPGPASPHSGSAAAAVLTGAMGAGVQHGAAVAGCASEGPASPSHKPRGIAAIMRHLAASPLAKVVSITRRGPRASEPGPSALPQPSPLQPPPAAPICGGLQHHDVCDRAGGEGAAGGADAAAQQSLPRQVEGPLTPQRHHQQQQYAHYHHHHHHHHHLQGSSCTPSRMMSREASGPLTPTSHAAEPSRHVPPHTHSCTQLLHAPQHLHHTHDTTQLQPNHLHQLHQHQQQRSLEWADSSAPSSSAPLPTRLDAATVAAATAEPQPPLPPGARRTLQQQQQHTTGHGPAAAGVSLSASHTPLPQTSVHRAVSSSCTACASPREHPDYPDSTYSQSASEAGPLDGNGPQLAAPPAPRSPPDRGGTTAEGGGKSAAAAAAGATPSAAYAGTHAHAEPRGETAGASARPAVRSAFAALEERVRVVETSPAVSPPPTVPPSALPSRMLADNAAVDAALARIAAKQTAAAAAPAPAAIAAEAAAGAVHPASAAAAIAGALAAAELRGKELAEAAPPPPQPAPQPAPQQAQDQQVRKRTPLQDLILPDQSPFDTKAQPTSPAAAAEAAASAIAVVQCRPPAALFSGAPHPQRACGHGPPPFEPLPKPAGDGPLFMSRAAPPAMWRPVWRKDDFHLSRLLYKGYSSEVVKAVCLRSQADVVLKVYALDSLSPFLTHQVLRELNVHSRLEHSGIVQLMAAFKEGSHLALVLEYVRGGSLERVRQKLGGRLSEAQALHLVILPLLRILRYLHGAGVVHRDIKPDNILFTSDWRLKLCDFGVSVCLDEERAVTRTGSREYMAPEVQVCPLKRGPGDNKDDAAMAYTTAVDVWSLGVMAYELLVGFTPFPGGAPTAASIAANGGRALAFPGSVSAAARGFVGACLAQHPGDRPTVQELLRHPWVSDASSTPILSGASVGRSD